MINDIVWKKIIKYIFYIWLHCNFNIKIKESLQSNLGLVSLSLVMMVTVLYLL